MTEAISIVEKRITMEVYPAKSCNLTLVILFTGQGAETNTYMYMYHVQYSVYSSTKNCSLVPVLYWSSCHTKRLRWMSTTFTEPNLPMTGDHPVKASHGFLLVICYFAMEMFHPISYPARDSTFPLWFHYTYRPVQTVLWVNPCLVLPFL
jgi:hypothetical protein